MITHKKPTISIAVLPFKNISPDQNLNYFSQGFTEDLITDLSKFSTRQVISYRSTAILVLDEYNEEELIKTINIDYNSELLDAGDKCKLANDYQQLRNILPNLKVIGGCCGTDHTHVEEICNILT